MSKVVYAEEAVSHIKDGSVVAVNGMLYLGQSEMFYKALEKRYLETGTPKNLTLYGICGLGHALTRGSPPDLANRLAHDGLIKKIVCSHYASLYAFFDKINSDAIEAYLISQGSMAQIMHSAARRVSRAITRIGVNTFLDPRHGGGKLNSVSKDVINELITMDGEEYLSYKTIYPDVCVIRGTTADINGNITFEKEASIFDPLVFAQAVKNNRGMLIVQVERLSGSYADPKLVKIPGRFVDYIIVDPGQRQMNTGKYNPAFTGELRAPGQTVLDAMKALIESPENKRSTGDRIIARRAALEIRKGDLVNLGLGIPMNVGLELSTMNRLGFDDFHFTVEVGSFGGIPAGHAFFGASINTDMLFNQYEQFEFYEGGGIDITFVGAMQVSAAGDVNVTGVKKDIKGVGGFNWVTQMADRVTFCTRFMRESGYVETENGPVPYDKGECKFTSEADYISFSSEVAKKNRQHVIYITERCVFERTDEGLMITEVSPYVNLEKDILAHLEFTPQISKAIKVMDDICFKVK